MWISKKKLKELNKRVADLEKKTKELPHITDKVIKEINRRTLQEGKNPLIM